MLTSERLVQFVARFTKLHQYTVNTSSYPSNALNFISTFFCPQHFNIDNHA